MEEEMICSITGGYHTLLQCGIEGGDTPVNSAKCTECNEEFKLI